MPIIFRKRFFSFISQYWLARFPKRAGRFLCLPISYRMKSLLKIGWLMAVGSFASAFVLVAASEAPVFEVLETKIISHQPEYFHGWPTVARRKNGELMVAYSGGREDHVCPFGRIEIITSRDDGKTWSWPRVIMDSATDDRDGGLLETDKGTLIVAFFTSVAYKQHLNNPERRINRMFGKDAAGHIERSKLAELRLSDQEKEADVGYWLLRSTDGGMTWSERLPIAFYSPHGPTQMADGRLFYAGADGKSLGAWISNDEGITWDRVAEIPGRAGETHGLEAADGTLIVQVRDKVAPPGGGGKRWATVQTESKDGGKTWTPSREIVAGFPSHLLKLKNNDLLMTYGVRKEPFGIRAKLSKDNGQTWSDEMILTQDAATEDMGYPSTVQLADGTLLTVWYEVPANSIKAQLRQAKWKIEP